MGGGVPTRLPLVGWDLGRTPPGLSQGQLSSGGPREGCEGGWGVLAPVGGGRCQSLLNLEL